LLDGWEWLIVGAVAIVVILWSPSKIPEFVKALGRAKGESQKPQDEFNKATNETAPAPSTSNFNMPPPSPPLKIRDEVLLGTARNLGISTDGKTRDQISDEISFRVKLLNAD
jgi:sec-independent protein translocase protein TatA